MQKRPQLLEEEVAPEFFSKEALRAWRGVALDVFAALLGYLVSPVIALAIFLLLPTFFAVTSDGLGEVQLGFRRRKKPSRAQPREALDCHGHAVSVMSSRW